MQVCGSGMCRQDGVPLFMSVSASPNIQCTAAVSAPGAGIVSSFYFEILCYPVGFRIRSPKCCPGLLTYFFHASSSLLLYSSAMMKWLLSTSAPRPEFQSLGVGKECSDTLILGEVTQNGVYGPPSSYQISIMNSVVFLSFLRLRNFSE